MILNPRTNRMIKVGSQMHRKAIRDGILTPDTIPKETEQKDIQKNIQNEIKKDIQQDTKEPPPEFTTQQGVAEICTDIIGENKKQFNKLSQDETNELLRKLLYEKLYSKNNNQNNQINQIKPISKEHKKPKLQLKKYYSSSESE